MSEQAVITVTTTIMQGTCVRWFRDVGAAANQRPVLSASREGVAVHATYLTDVPDAWVADAKRAHGQLRRAPRADMTSWATHERREVLGARSGPLDPVKKES
jgi:hypothetical protein